MDREIRALCIRTTDYRETDKLITLISVEEGKITATAKGVRKPASKLKTACMPLSFGEYSLSNGRGGEILTGAAIEENFFHCWNDVEKNLSAMLTLELLDKICPPGADSKKELVAALKALKEINYGKVKPLAVCSWFMAVVLNKFLGDDFLSLPFEKDRLMLKALSDMEPEEVTVLESDEELFNIICVLNSVFCDSGIRLKLLDSLKKYLLDK